MPATERSSRIRSIFQRGRATRASIVIPFIIISLALAVLAYRSYQLSVRMERGLTTLAVQYLGYAAEMTAHRADAAIREQIDNAREDWRQYERSAGVMDYSAVQQWTLRHPWITSAIYVPDDAPEDSVFVREPEQGDESARVTSEFYTATGMIRYTYDPTRLVEAVRKVVTRTPEIHAPQLPEAGELRDSSSLALIKRSDDVAVAHQGEGMSVTFPLAAPLDRYAIRASVSTAYVGSGWSNHRILSLWLAAVAFVLVTVGMGFAIRGLQQEAEATQLRAALIANVSHELRTPLSMIRLAAETLKRGAKLKPKDRSDLEDSILREVLHLTHLVENVLDVARLQKSARPRPFASVDPVDLVRSVVVQYDGWIKSKGFEVEVNIDPAIPVQMWDRESVSRALLNLIDNAIKYSADEKIVFVSLRESEDSIEIAVRDRGIGIAQHELTKIFDPYYRAAFSDTETRRGAGLGLTLVQQIVSSHGGKIEVDSTPGEGSTFRLLFPKAPAAPVGEAAELLRESNATS
jgi:signal transduction histidine kinase